MGASRHLDSLTTTSGFHSRTSEIQTDAPPPVPDPTMVILTALALIIAVAIPAIGMWAMLLLFLQGAIGGAVQRRRSSPASIHE